MSKFESCKNNTGFDLNLFPVKTHSTGNLIKVGHVLTLHSLEMFVSAAGSTL